MGIPSSLTILKKNPYYICFYQYNYGVPPIRYSSKRDTTVFPEALVLFGTFLNLLPKFIFKYLMLKGCLKMSMHF